MKIQLVHRFFAGMGPGYRLCASECSILLIQLDVDMILGDTIAQHFSSWLLNALNLRRQRGCPRFDDFLGLDRF
ncbi:hypothetical protein D3C76_1572790 [compost metagenome]